MIKYHNLLMNKRILILAFCFSLIINLNTARAGSLYGNGDIEISRALHNYIEQYLGSGIKNATQGAKSRGRGMYLAISTSPTEWGASSYCPYTACQDDSGRSTKSNCQKAAKKKYSQKVKCKLLIKGHTIKWNGMKIKYSEGDDLEALLETAGVTVKD